MRPEGEHSESIPPLATNETGNGPDVPAFV